VKETLVKQNIHEWVLFHRAVRKNVPPMEESMVDKWQDARFGKLLAIGSIMGLVFAGMWLYFFCRPRNEAHDDYYQQLYEPIKRRAAKGLMFQDELIEHFGRKPKAS